MTAPILIVDDSLTVRMDLKEACAEAGFETILCPDLATARQTLQRQPIALAILDVLLPDGDGIELLQEIRLHPPTAALPVLLLSTEAEVRDRARGLVSGADGYLGKPYDRRAVIQRARELLLRQRSTPAEPRRAPLILVIDDSLTSRCELSAVLEASGYAVQTAETGEEGLRLAGRIRPDAVIVDGQLPGIDGVTVVRRLRGEPGLRHLPCLMLTGSPDKEYELPALEAGIDSFVSKEEGIDVILSRLTVLLRTAVAPTPLTGSAALVGAKRILAVDGSPDFLNVLVDELAKEEFEVIAARSGAEAFQALATTPIDCVLLEWDLPDMTGEQACRQIKSAAATRDVPVLIVTAHNDPDVVLNSLKAGADDYIPKTVEMEVLKGRVRAHLRRKQQEEENRLIAEVIDSVRQSEARFRGAFDHTHVATALLDSEQRCVRVNAAFAQLFGQTPDALQRLTLCGLMHPDDVAQCREQTQELLENRSSHFQREIRWRRGDVSWFWGLTNVSLVRGSDGKPVQYVCQVHDISERKKAEESNQRFTERLQILHQIDRALLAGDDPGQIAGAALPLLRELLGVHRAIVNLFDLAAGQVEWLAAAGRRRVHVGPGVRFPLRFMGDVEALKRGEPQVLDIETLPPGPEVDALRVSGVDMYVAVPMLAGSELIGALSFGGGAEAFSAEQIAIAQEVAAQFAVALTQTRMKRDLQAKNDELREISQQLWQTAKLATMGELAASIAHELNNPLGTVSLGIEDLLAHLPAESPACRELRVMEQETERMARLVANLLQFSRPGQQQVSTFDVTEEIDRTLELTSFVTRRRRVRVAREYATGLPPIQADRQKLRQVFLNLIVNASDAMPHGGTLTVRVTLGQLPSGKPAVVLEFADTGTGIAPEHLAKIMEPFFTTKPEGRGTGLGLAICRRVVQDHHGLIEVASKLGEGTTFRIALPVQNGDNGKQLDED